MIFDAYAQNTLLYKEEKCVNCDRCIEVCPHSVFVRGERAVIMERRTACMECGACALNCPTNALSVNSGVGCAYYLMYEALFGAEKAECKCAE